MNLQMDRIQHACDVLKLNTMATEWSAIADRAASTDGSIADFLEQLLTVEIHSKQQRTRDALLKFSGLPATKRFEDYDFKFASGAPKKQLQELTSLAFIERMENIVLLGPSVIVTSNLPFSQWSTAFADDKTLTTALLARLLHHAHIVQIAGNSYRLKGKKTAGISPELTPVKKY